MAQPKSCYDLRRLASERGFGTKALGRRVGERGGGGGGEVGSASEQAPVIFTAYVIHG